MVTLPPMRRMENEAAAARLQQNFGFPTGNPQAAMPRPPGMAMQQGMPTPQALPPRPAPQQAMPVPPPQPKPQQPAPIQSFREPAPAKPMTPAGMPAYRGKQTDYNQSDRPIYPTNPVPPPRPQPQPQPQYPQPRPETPMPRNNYLLTRAAEEANLRGRQIGRFQDAMRRFGGNRTYALHYALRYGA